MLEGAATSMRPMAGSTPRSVFPIATAAAAAPGIPRTAHAAAPPKVDFGDVQTGTQRITSFAVWNLVNIGAALHVGYEGDPTIQLISSPTNIRKYSMGRLVMRWRIAP